MVGVNPTILHVLISVQKAVAEASIECSPKAIYWAKFTTLLIDHIEKNRELREDLYQFLADALTRPTIQFSDEFIHA